MRTTPMPQIMLYTTQHCPDCRTLKAWLVSQGIAFVERDLADPQVAEEAKAQYGVRVAPVTVVDEHVFYGRFEHQYPQLVDVLGMPRAGSN